VFIDIYYTCREGIVTYPDIEAFKKSTQTDLSIYEVQLIRRMSSWANSEEQKAYKEEQGKKKDK
jgi:hypothetical protein